ncbi:hypothetical protein B0H13DRAFT_2102777 [Mycena leptocephala]|nr:hypothetical protein B0H13DRAFT_2102777 [Mycena leptocephala]
MCQHLLELPPAMWLALPSTLPFAQCMKRPQDTMYKSAIRVGANEDSSNRSAVEPQVSCRGNHLNCGILGKPGEREFFNYDAVVLLSPGPPRIKPESAT